MINAGLDIREVITHETGLRFKRKKFLEYCPFCGSGTGPNKSSAFHVHDNGYTCFSCSEKGDSVIFIERIRGVSKAEAIEVIRKEYKGEADDYTSARRNKTKRTHHRKKSNTKYAPIEDNYFIPVDILQQTQTGYEKNIFIQNLRTHVPFPFEVQDVGKAISLYQLGTVPGSGAVCFPFIDINRDVRAIQEKIFDKHNHTDKTKRYPTTWIHSRLKYTTHRNRPLPQWLEDYEKNETKVSCLFGEHLLSKYPYNPVALVEAPKTAIYGTLYFGFPDTGNVPVWLSTGGESFFTFDRIESLSGRAVLVCPDLSKDGKTYAEWESKASDFEKRLPGTIFKVSNLLERLAPDADRNEGYDLADYLIKQDWRKFRKQSPKKYAAPEPQPEITTNDTSSEAAISTTIVNTIEHQPTIKPPESEPSVIPFSKPNNRPQRSEIKEEHKPIGRTIEAYTNHSNELLIQNPMEANRFTVYPDVESYNRRSVVPESRYKDTIDMSTLTPVSIDPEKLIVVNYLKIEIEI